MTLSASEKLEVIRMVEESDLSVKRTLEEIGVSRSSFYRWYDQYLAGGLSALEGDVKANCSEVARLLVETISREIQ